MTFDEYKERLWQSFRESLAYRADEWRVPDSLEEKVTADGSMDPFFGATALIRLAETDRARCDRLQARLLAQNPDMLVPLRPATFHMTVHPFCNGYDAGERRDEVRREMEQSEDAIEAEFRQIAETSVRRELRMKALGISPLGKEVVAVRLAPQRREDYELLMDLSGRLNRIYPVDQWLLPHVSLGYFKLRSYSGEALATLYETVEALSREAAAWEMTLPIGGLTYCHHYDMNDFEERFSVAGLQEATSF